MNNILFGLAVGVVVGYILRRMEDQRQFECLENELHGLTDKAKKKVKDVVNTGKNQVEYVKITFFFIFDVTFFQIHSSYKKKV